MASRFSIFGLLTILLAIANLTSVYAAFQQSSKAQTSRQIMHSLSSIPDVHANACTDIAASTKLHTPEINNEDAHVLNSLSVPKSLHQALSIIKSVETLPSCAKVASSALMHSCSALGGSIQHDETNYARGSDLFVAEETDIYAARLAVCELRDAEYPLPKECQPFVPTDRGTKKREVRGWWTKSGPTKPTNLFQYYDDITEANLKQCRKALSSDGRSWTSFSNSKQNAIVMCRAMRSEVEKDEQLYIGKILADTAAAAAESLQDTIDRSKIMKAMFHEITTAMPQFQQDLVAGNQQQVEWVQKFWTGLERVQDRLQDVFTGVAGIQDQVSHANHGVADLRAGIANAANLSALQVQDALSRPVAEIGEMSESVAAINQLIDFVHEKIMQEGVKSLYNINQEISLVNAFVPQLHQEVATYREANLRMHEENARSHERIQHYANETMESLEQVQEHLHAFAKVITDVVEHGWTGVLPHLWCIAFTSFCFVVSFFFSFATLGHVLGLALSNNIAASLGSAIREYTPCS